MKLHFLLMVFLIFTYCSCAKIETIEVEYSKVKISAEPIQGLFCLNDSIALACSGIEDVGGKIYRMQGDSWSEVFSTDQVNLLSVYMLPSGKAFAGGDFVHLYHSNDEGQTWQLDWMEPEELSTHEHNRVSIDEFHFIDDSIGFFVGGDRYEHGHIYRTRNQGESWNFDTLRNEVSCLTEIDNTTFLFGGYGYMGKTTDQGNTLHQLEIDNNYFIGVHAIGNNSIIALTNRGRVLISEDIGNSWKTISKLRGSLILNSAYANGVLFAIGSKGTCCYSTDHGNQWKKINLNTQETLHGISVSDNFLGLSSHAGEIYTIPLKTIL